ncbi:MAG TPA: aminopeptidase [Actinomycetota bacterium]|jgi:aminopeptidase|nr:aminopeptidase [Actinomycetota bacterium]
MKDQRIERLADVLIGYSLKVKPQDTVQIKGAYVAEPLMLALYRRCLAAGAYPKLLVSLPEAEPLFYRYASDEQLGFVWPTDEWAAENVDCSISIISETNTRALSRVDPARQVIASRARKHLLDTFMRRSAAGEFRWMVTLFPTQAHAMEAEMSLEEYEDFFFRACLVDAEDPVAEWEQVAERHRRLEEWLSGRREMHITGEGTDLYLDVSDRRWIPCDGGENFPDGEIFTGPVETATRGHITFSYPAIYGGNVVEGIRLTFTDGRVTDASANKNEEFLITTLDADEGGRVIGEAGIGTNYGITDFSGEILLDEKIGGTVHLALGASYPETGGTNESAIHWDMVCDLRRGGRITFDGDVLMEDGRLLV